MAGCIYLGDESVWLSNSSIQSLTEWAIQVGTAQAKEDIDATRAARLAKWCEAEYFPGQDLQLETLFPQSDDKKFWAGSSLWWRGKFSCESSVVTTQELGKFPQFLMRNSRAVLWLSMFERLKRVGVCPPHHSSIALCETCVLASSAQDTYYSQYLKNDKIVILSRFGWVVPMIAIVCLLLGNVMLGDGWSGNTWGQAGA